MYKVQLNTVSGFEDMKNYYQVVRDGERCWVEGKDSKILKTKNSGRGYLQYCLYLSSGKPKYILQHRLFAICFIPNTENKEQVNHIDGMKSNNILTNLEWNTRSENMQHADRTGLRDILGENNGRAKLTNSDLPIIFELRKQGFSLKAIGEQFVVGKAQIHRILTGKSHIK